MQARTPSPVAPPHAQSRVTRSGHSMGRAIRSTASLGRLQAGSGAAGMLSSSAACWAACSGSCAMRSRSYNRRKSDELTLRTSGAVRPENPTASALDVAEALAQLVDQRTDGLIALPSQRRLEICDQSGPKLEVLLGPRDDLVEAAPGSRQLGCSLHPAFGGGSQQAQKLAEALLVISGRSRHPRITRPPSGLVSSLQLLPQLPQTARNPAGDRAGRQIERGADRPVALVLGEEAVEDLLAGFGQLGKRLPDGKGLLEVGHRAVVARR